MHERPRVKLYRVLLGKVKMGAILHSHAITAGDKLVYFFPESGTANDLTSGDVHDAYDYIGTLTLLEEIIFDVDKLLLMK